MPRSACTDTRNTPFFDSRFPEELYDFFTRFEAYARADGLDEQEMAGLVDLYTDREERKFWKKLDGYDYDYSTLKDNILRSYSKHALAGQQYSKKDLKRLITQTADDDIDDEEEFEAYYRRFWRRAVYLLDKDEIDDDDCDEYFWRGLSSRTRARLRTYMGIRHRSYVPAMSKVIRAGEEMFARCRVELDSDLEMEVDDGGEVEEGEGRGEVENGDISREDGDEEDRQEDMCHVVEAAIANVDSNHQEEDDTLAREDIGSIEEDNDNETACENMVNGGNRSNGKIPSMNGSDTGDGNDNEDSDDEEDTSDDGDETASENTVNSDNRSNSEVPSMNSSDDGDSDNEDSGEDGEDGEDGTSGNNGSNDEVNGDDENSNGDDEDSNGDEDGNDEDGKDASNSNNSSGDKDNSDDDNDDDGDENPVAMFTHCPLPFKASTTAYHVFESVDPQSPSSKHFSTPIHINHQDRSDFHAHHCPVIPSFIYQVRQHRRSTLTFPEILSKIRAFKSYHLFLPLLSPHFVPFSILVQLLEGQQFTSSLSVLHHRYSTSTGQHLWNARWKRRRKKGVYSGDLVRRMERCRLWIWRVGWRS